MSQVVRILNKIYNNHLLDRNSIAPEVYNLSLLTSLYGSLTAAPLTGYAGSTAGLTATPDADCHFVDYELTGIKNYLTQFLIKTILIFVYYSSLLILAFLFLNLLFLFLLFLLLLLFFLFLPFLLFHLLHQYLHLHYPYRQNIHNIYYIYLLL